MSRNTFQELVNSTSHPFFYLKGGVTAENSQTITSNWYNFGNPTNGHTRGTGNIADGQALYANTTGAMIYPSGSIKYVSSIRRTSSQTTNGCMLLIDRLWHNTGLSTSAVDQDINSIPWPQRDNSGLSSGYGVYVALEVNNSLAAPLNPVTGLYINYTNTENISNRVGYIRFIPGTCVAGSFLPFSLADGDVGVKSVQILNLASSLITGGNVCLVAYRVIEMVTSAPGNKQSDVFNLSMTKIWADSCLCMLSLGPSSSQTLNFINFVGD